MAAFLGMRGDGNWTTGQRPLNWREGILYLYPNGSAPLTAMLSKMKSEKTDDPEFNWWTKTLPTQRATVTGIYTDVLSTAYVSGGVAGNTIYLKMSAADAGQFVAGKQILMRLSTDYRLDTVGKVSAVAVINGSSSYITVKLLEADDNGVGKDLSDIDTVLIIGNINEEGALRPNSIAYDPTKINNYTQIFRNSLMMTRTAIKTRLRTDDARKEAKREALELHSIEMEKAFFFGIATENTGTLGFPERTTMGIIPAIKAYAPLNCVDYTLDTNYSGKTWLEGGEAWLDATLEQIFRYGRPEKMVFAGSGALLGINRLVKSLGRFEFTPTTKGYGIQVVEWVTPFGKIYFKTHPLFSYEATTRNSMVVVEPENLNYRYIDDTMFKGDPTMTQGGETGVDGIREEFLTEAGLEFHFPQGWGFLNGVGTDNTLS